MALAKTMRVTSRTLRPGVCNKSQNPRDPGDFRDWDLGFIFKIWDSGLGFGIYFDSLIWIWICYKILDLGLGLRNYLQKIRDRGY